MANRIPLVVDASTNRLAELPTYDTLYLDPSDVVANSFIGDGSQLSNVVAESANTANTANFAGVAFAVDAANIIGIVANANYASNAGNAIFSINAGNANIALIAETVSNAAQPNITSVGNLTSLVVTGNIDPYNINLVKFDENVQASSNATGTITPDMNLGSIHNYLLTGNITLNTLANAAPGATATLILTQDTSGNRILTSNMKFAGNVRTLSTAANSIDILCVLYDGNTYFASLTKGYV